MQEFNHPHVLSLIGVCLDTGPGVSMVMPFMTNGSLLDYLKRERDNLETKDAEDFDKVGANSDRPPYRSSLANTITCKMAVFTPRYRL